MLPNILNCHKKKRHNHKQILLTILTLPNQHKISHKNKKDVLSIAVKKRQNFRYCTVNIKTFLLKNVYYQILGISLIRVQEKKIFNNNISASTEISTLHSK